ncbi:Ubiquitin carboxyl-terminal hydrolase 20 [Myotis brandtii]|uniref:Ubiquitin carboxyl-terminal hydrolase 20 n=1 Tax=Myotis brandtii TaxID=109478 RepID=S7MSZ0_MYOBR|nr:Ubiquitin carboxyl-terminal hydrolase 20 [Myotis brandtii]
MWRSAAARVSLSAEVACPYVGCGESFADHSTIHAQAQKHNLTVNLTTFRVWCYACEKEVFPEQRLAAPLPAASPRLFEQPPAESWRPGPPAPSPHVAPGGWPLCTARAWAVWVVGAGLTGMKNLGNSCYMNAALQALSNCPPLTQFFLECGGLVRTDKKPALCKSYQKLVSEVWHRKRPSYVVPTSLSHGIKLVNPMFRGYAQQVGICAAPGHQGHYLPGLALKPGPARRAQQRPGAVGGSFHRQSLLAAGCRSPHAADGEPEAQGHAPARVPRLGQAQPPSPRSASPCRTPEPDNEAHMRSASRPCSPVHHHEGHTKLASSPPRASPVRMGPAYVLKKAQGLSMGSRRRKEQRYRSVISDIFDGSILSLVQCLTCDRVSTTVETFQDLSLPIPGKEDLAKLHSAIYQNAPAKPGSCGDSYAAQGWLAFIMEYIRRFVVSCTPSWFWGPVITLEDCLAAFFAADELKGDNMYSCERCKKKSSEEAVRERQQVVSLAAMREPSLLRFYVSREWLNKFNTFAEPGPITNHTFLCSHGGIPPNKYHYIDDLVVILPQNVWEHLYSRFGGGPAVNHLYVCSICQVEIEALAKRRRIEIDTFIKLNKAFQAEESPGVIYCISMQWFREWEAFVKGKDNEPPGPIDNSRIAQVKGSGHIQLKPGADYGQISEETWAYLHSLYGGGPEIAIRQSVAQLPDPDSLHGEQKIEAETRAL